MVFEQMFVSRFQVVERVIFLLTTPPTMDVGFELFLLEVGAIFEEGRLV